MSSTRLDYSLELYEYEETPSNRERQESSEWLLDELDRYRSLMIDTQDVWRQFFVYVDDNFRSRIKLMSKDVSIPFAELSKRERLQRSEQVSHFLHRYKRLSSKTFHVRPLLIYIDDYENYSKLQEHQDRFKFKSPIKLANIDVSIPNEVLTLIKEHGLPENTSERLAEVIQAIQDYLESQNQQYKVSVERVGYPEEDASDEIKLNIQVKCDYDYIEKVLKEPLYDIIIQSLPKKVLGRILIKFETL